MVIMLEVIGVGADAEIVYEALADACPGTLDGLSAMTGLPRDRLRHGLEVLEMRGLVHRAPGEHSEYVLADPGGVLDVLLFEREQQLEKARMWAQDLAERHRRALGGQDPGQLVEIVSGHAAIVQRVKHVQRIAVHELRAFDKPPYATDASVLNSAEVDLLARGGIARTIYESAAADRPDRLIDLEQGIAAGEQARVLPSLPMKLILVDNTQAIMPLEAAPVAMESIVVVRHPALVQAMAALFESLWQLALPLELASADLHLLDQPGPTERHLLALLTAGLSDEAIARQLGLSVRTFQRRIHDLMERANSRTRFQLARQAARRGWLDDIEEPVMSSPPAD
jgi:DNA-binding CsgD family transcriptional regulator/sugar-specific transcriptional regulator TrmB